MREEENRTGIRMPSMRQMTTVLSVLTCLILLFWGFNTFRLKQVTIDGLTRYTEEEFKAKLDWGIASELTPLFSLLDVFHKQEIPFVETYEIDYVDSHTARIIVHEKRVTGGVLLMGRYMYFDKDGIVVESSEERLSDLPLISGLVFDEIVLYKSLQVQKASLFDTILQLTRLIEQLELPISEIAFDSNYEVTLYSGDRTVLLGKRTNYDEPLNALSGIFAAMQEKTGTLDMRNYSKENPDVILK